MIDIGKNFKNIWMKGKLQFSRSSATFPSMLRIFTSMNSSQLMVMILRWCREFLHSALRPQS